MPEQLIEELKEGQPKKKKGILGKLKEASEDKEEQLAILSTFVRLGILIWSGGILTLAYVDLPKALQFPEQDLDPTFILRLYWGFATFGVQTAKGKNGNGNGGGGISKEDMERLIAAAKETAPAQTIRIEQAPIKISTDDTYKL